jgi:acyl carrier protein
MTTDRTISVIAAAFGQTVDSIPEDGTIGQVPGWDSLGHMRLMLALEAETGRQMTPEEITTIISVPAIRAFLSA